eukprot:gene6053-4345_t
MEELTVCWKSGEWARLSELLAPHLASGGEQAGLSNEIKTNVLPQLLKERRESVFEDLLQLGPQVSWPAGLWQVAASCDLFGLARRLLLANPQRGLTDSWLTMDAEEWLRYFGDLCTDRRREAELKAAVVVGEALGHTNNRHGGSALLFALSVGCSAAAQALLQLPTLDVNAATSEGVTALVMATEREELALVAALLRRGARVQLPRRREDAPPIGIFAVLMQKENAQLLRLFVEGGLPVVPAERFGPLRLPHVLSVVRWSNWIQQLPHVLALLECLLTRRRARARAAAAAPRRQPHATPTRPGRGEDDPLAVLHVACRRGLVDVARQLLDDAGADANLPTATRRRSPLLFALTSAEPQATQLVAALLRRGADPQAPDAQGRSLLAAVVADASAAPRLSADPFARSAPSSPSSPDADDGAALSVAQRFDRVLLLAQAGVEADAASLQLAVARGWAPVAVLLLLLGADAHAPRAAPPPKTTTLLAAALDDCHRQRRARPNALDEVFLRLARRCHTPETLAALCPDGDAAVAAAVFADHPPHAPPAQLPTTAMLRCAEALRLRDDAAVAQLRRQWRRFVDARVVWRRPRFSVADAAALRFDDGDDGDDVAGDGGGWWDVAGAEQLAERLPT